jgi:tetratricopeptide (TPR) repeat protein
VDRISLCLIVRDEERFLPGCLASVAGAVDEIVVADTGSTDRTVEIARAAGANVVHHAWNDDFSVARNAALAAASGDWILLLDADERLAPGAGEALREAVRQGGFHCGLLRLTDANHLEATPEAVLDGSAALREPVWLARLFRRTDDLRWEGRVHEHVNTWLAAHGGRATLVEADIVHYGAVPSLRRDNGKDERNLRLLRREVQESPDNWSARSCLAENCLYAGHLQEAREQAQTAWEILLRALPHMEAVPCGVVKALTVYAAVLLQKGAIREALVVLEEGAAFGLAHPNPSYLEGLARENLALHDPPRRSEHLAKAAAAFESALAFEGSPLLDPPIRGATGSVSRLRLGIVRLQQGAWEPALRELHTAASQAEDPTEARLAIAEVWIEMGRCAEALSLLMPELTESAPADAWLLAADASRRLGDDAAFETCLARAYERVRDHLVGLHRLERLNGLLAAAG